MPNYQTLMEQQMEKLPAGTPLLLHACCGPCASAVLERLCAHFRVTVFYYNPAIAPQAEYQKRRDTLLHLLNQIKTPLPLDFREGPCDEGLFLRAAAGLETAPEGGARCAVCFRQRLEETARQAHQLGIGWFATTLSVSPHKNAPLLNQLGEAAALQWGVGHLPADFKKKGGYQRSIQLSAEYGLYRQASCGCRFSASPGRPAP